MHWHVAKGSMLVNERRSRVFQEHVELALARKIVDKFRLALQVLEDLLLMDTLVIKGADNTRGVLICVIDIGLKFQSFDVE